MNNITKQTMLEARKTKYLNEDYVVEKSKDNKNIIRILKNNKKIYMGSIYNVSRDTHNVLNKMNIEKSSVIIIFGLGTGEYIREIKEKNFTYNKIIIIEPDVHILNCFFREENNEDILNDDKLYIINFDKSSFYQMLCKIIKEWEVKKIQYAAFANYPVTYKSEFKACTDEIQSYVNVALSNLGTELKFSKLWFECYVKNLRYMKNSSPVNYFKGVFKEKPCVIVSAGPSLEKNIKFLQEYKDKCIIICCGRTIKSLLDLNIVPDFLCVIDPDDVAYMQVKDCEYGKVPLVYFERTNWKVVENHSGNKVINSFDEGLYKMLGTNVGVLDHGGSVAHNCLGLAVKLRCSPIMFIGQDFAYTNNKSHASIVSGGNHSINLDEEQIYIDDIYGNKIKTSSILNLYKEIMEKMIVIYSDRYYINCTEGGANISGTKIMSFSNALDKYCIQNINKNTSYLFEKDNKISEASIIRSLEEKLQLCKDIIENPKNEFKIEEDSLLKYVYYPLKVKDNNLSFDFYNELAKEMQEAANLICETINFIKGDIFGGKKHE